MHPQIQRAVDDLRLVRDQLQTQLDDLRASKAAAPRERQSSLSESSQSSAAPADCLGAFVSFASAVTGGRLGQSEAEYCQDVLLPLVSKLVSSALETMPVRPEPFLRRMLNAPDVSHTGRRTSEMMREIGYAGAYATLVDFLAEHKDELAARRFKQLETAIESLSTFADKRKGVSVNQEHFLGHEEEFSKVLPSLGIAIEKRKASRASFALHFSHLPEDGSSNIDFLAKNFHKSEQELDEVLGSLSFDKRLWVGKDLSNDACWIMHCMSTPHDLMKRYDIRTEKLYNWLIAIGMKYNQHAYHNWRHAFDVFQFTYLMLATGKGANHFNYQDIMALLLSAIGHDVGHVGYNNAFLVNSQHELALMYNDISPLENMHSAKFFEEMRSEEQNFLGSMSQHSFLEFRSKVVECILATDMSHHFELVDRVATRVNALDADAPGANTNGIHSGQLSSKADRRLLMQSFTHMADIGISARPWDVSKHNVVAVEDEFFMQGDQERMLGMPILPMMDRTKDSAATGQSFFLDKLVKPLLLPYTRLFSKEIGDTLLSNLESNKNRWATLVERHGKKTARELMPLWAGDSSMAECRTQSFGRVRSTVFASAIATEA